jgi:signal peptidase I
VRWRLVAVAGLVLGLVLGVRAWVVDVVSVSSDSMAPTLCTGDLLAVSKLPRHQSIKASDIVKDGLLEVDGKLVDEPYVDQATIDGVYFGPVTVPSSTVFVMGDSREFSIDSRAFGPIPASDIDGRLLAALWSTCDH